MPSLVIHGSYQELITHLHRIKQAPKKMTAAVARSAEFFEKAYIYHLQYPSPELSDATQKLKREANLPEEQGLVEQIKLQRKETPRGVKFVVTLESDRAQTIAAVQEYGAAIQVTDKMRGFLSHHGIHLRGDTQVIRIPGRRPMEKAWQDTKKECKLIFDHTLKSL